MEILSEYSDLRVAEKEILTIPQLAKNYYIHLLPELPWYTNKIISYKEGELNLFKYFCTCSDHLQRIELFSKPRDVRRICKHLFYKITNDKLKNNFDQLSLLLLKSTAIHRELLHFKFEYLDENYYFGFNPGTNWINVYLQQEGNFRRFSFNPIEYRWSYQSEPEKSAYAILMMERLMDSQLPFTHNWTIKQNIQR